MQTALVTGGSGYVAGQLIALLLQEGYSVHATVRSLANPAKNRALNELVRKYPGRLELHEADLLVVEDELGFQRAENVTDHGECDGGHGERAARGDEESVAMDPLERRGRCG